MKTFHKIKEGVKDVNNIKFCRERAGVTQAQLATVVGIDRTAISKWESGETLPRADKLPAIAAALGCTVDELLTSEESEEKDG